MNENSLTLRPHIMKICRLTQKTYQTDARWTETAQIGSVAKITSLPSYLLIKRISTCGMQPQTYTNVKSVMSKVSFLPFFKCQKFLFVFKNIQNQVRTCVSDRKGIFVCAVHDCVCVWAFTMRSIVPTYPSKVPLVIINFIWFKLRYLIVTTSFSVTSIQSGSRHKIGSTDSFCEYMSNIRYRASKQIMLEYARSFYSLSDVVWDLSENGKKYFLMWP